MSNTDLQYEWLAPKLLLSEREALDRIWYDFTGLRAEVARLAGELEDARNAKGRCETPHNDACACRAWADRESPRLRALIVEWAEAYPPTGIHRDWDGVLRLDKAEKALLAAAKEKRP